MQALNVLVWQADKTLDPGVWGSVGGGLTGTLV
jgi:hypothetical protein